MREARAGVVALLSLLLVLPAVLAQTQQSSAAWDEVAGGAARTGAAFLPATTLDVLESRDLLGDDLRIALQYTKGLVSTPHGILALATRGNDCILVRLRNDQVEENPLQGCTDGTLTAYDRARDRLLVCSRGGPGDAILQSRDALTGQVVWSTTPVGLGSLGAPGSWNCRGTALAPEGDVYVAFWAVAPGGGLDAEPINTILARIDAVTGGVSQSRPISRADFFVDGLPFDAGSGGFTPFGISVTENGVVVSGRLTCGCGKGTLDTGVSTAQGGVVWLDRALDFTGGRLAEDDPRILSADPTIPSRYFHAWWASTSGPLAAFALGDRMLLVNPLERGAVREAPFAGIETGRSFIGIVPSAWWEDVIVVPISKSVTGFDPESLDKPLWSQTFGDAWVVSGLAVLPPTDVLVLVAENPAGRTDEFDTKGDLVRLDLATGKELQRVDLPGTIKMSGGTGRAGFQPMDDGTLLIYSLDGRLFRLGTADASLRPAVTLSNEYPAPSEGVTLSIGAPEATVNYTIAWGDGTVETHGTSWTHRYGDARPHTVRVTAQFADGRTATTERVIRVGEAPPAELNALQVAFSDKWQNVTFGVLGLLITLAFSLIALYARRRRHSRLHDELVELERIREQGRNDTEGAIRALGAYRERLLREIAAHRLDDAQFNSLEARANVVFGALRTRLLGPLAGRLSADFRHALDVVLHDGRLDATELAGLTRALDAERQLSAEERAQLGRLFDRLATS